MRKYEYHYQPPSSRPKKNSRAIRLVKGLSLVTFCIILFLVFYSVYKIAHENLIQKAVISPVAASFAGGIDSARKIFFKEKLSEVVKKSLAGSSGTYAVAIKNLKTGESFYLNEEKKFLSASLYKLWVLGEAYRQIEREKLDPDKVLTARVVDINEKFEIASDSAELTEGTITARVQDAISQMIVISNNYAALLLASELEMSNVNKFLKNYGFSDSKTGNPPITTANDIAGFYEKLYAGLLGNKNSTAAMIDILKMQQLNDRIPKYLPDNVSVAHKTGELDGYKHDAGIVYASNGAYIIVMLSKTEDEVEAAEREALVSKAVYKYFEKK